MKSLRVVLAIVLGLSAAGCASILERETHGLFVKTNPADPTASFTGYRFGLRL